MANPTAQHGRTTARSPPPLPLLLLLLLAFLQPAAPAVSHGTCSACAATQTSASTTSAWTVGLPSYGGKARHHPITFSDGVRGYLLTGVSGDFDMYRYDPTQVRWRQHVWRVRVHAPYT